MMKFTCSALMLGSLASTSLGEISNYDLVLVSYYAESNFGDNSNGSVSTVDEFEDLFVEDIASYDYSAGGTHIWNEGDISTTMDSQGYQLNGSVNTFSDQQFTQANGRVWGEGTAEGIARVSFELFKQTEVQFNASSAVEGLGTASFHFWNTNTNEILLSGEANSMMEQVQLTLGPGMYSAQIFFQSDSDSYNPNSPDMPDFASASLEMTVVPSPSSVLALPMALGMVCRRRR
ncbi:MAG: hypothetical protein JJ974_03950 [Phycisphaerales bacterium]|nr:hypothetical protein [Phycisphaerales bacterium]